MWVQKLLFLAHQTSDFNYIGWVLLLFSFLLLRNSQLWQYFRNPSILMYIFRMSERMQNNATWMPFLTYIASYFFQVIYQGKKILILTLLSMSGDERKLIKKNIYIYMYIYTKITLLSFSNTRSDLDQLGLLTHKSIINIPKLFSFLIINYL